MKRNVNIYEALVTDKHGTDHNMGPVRASNRSQAAAMMRCSKESVKCKEVGVKRNQDERVADHIIGTLPMLWALHTLREGRRNAPRIPRKAKTVKKQEVSAKSGKR